MQRLHAANLNASIQREWRKILLLALLLLVFVSNAVGFIQFSGNFLPDLTFQINYFTDTTGDFHVPAIVTSAEFFLLLATGCLLVVFLPLLSPIGASVLVLTLALPPVLLAIALPYRYNTVPMQFSLLVILVLFGVNVLLKYFAETREKQVLLDIFSQYLPPQLVGALSHQSQQIALQGESRLLTIMFCDLRNFTAMTEQLKPQDVALLLNAFFTAMTTVLFKYGATIDKYIGDSIMAFWGAPVPQEDHVQRAIDAAFEMHQQLQTLAPLFHARGLPAPGMGIGINTGVVNVGNMGSRYRLAYTVIGDAVNLASRLQSATRVYCVDTVVGEETAKRYPAMQFRELDTVALRGKSRLTRIYQPLCLKQQSSPELDRQLALHTQALAMHYANQPSQAAALFRELQQTRTEDLYYTVMLDKTGQPVPY
jgi:adenylate cyclase